MALITRNAEQMDIQDIVQLIQEKRGVAEDELKDISESFRQDGFGPERIFHCVVAEALVDGMPKLIAYALGHLAYGTFSGRTFWVEEMSVHANYKHTEAATEMFSLLAKVAVNAKCVRFDSKIHGWRKTARELWEKCGGSDVTVEDNYHLFSLPTKPMHNLAVVNY